MYQREERFVLFLPMLSSNTTRLLESRIPPSANDIPKGAHVVLKPSSAHAACEQARRGAMHARHCLVQRHHTWPTWRWRTAYELFERGSRGGSLPRDHLQPAGAHASMLVDSGGCRHLRLRSDFPHPETTPDMEDDRQSEPFVAETEGSSRPDGPEQRAAFHPVHHDSPSR